MTPPILETAVSLGLNVKKPQQLSMRSVGSMLAGFREGEWRDPVEKVRSLPWDSLEQKSAKELLPFWTPAGTFSRRANASLLAHSGIYPIDLDGLSESDTNGAIQRAITDRFCLAACRSCRGLGVRLLFRVPKCNAEEHSLLFDQVGAHVRSVYGHEPDTCRDVSRASFVSWDNGLWIFAGADELPLVIPAKKLPSLTQRYNRCVKQSLCSGRETEAPFSFLGREHAPHKSKDDGSAVTHNSLLKLGLAMACLAWRNRVDIENCDIDETIRAWSSECHRKGLHLRGSMNDYREELRGSVDGASRKPWFREAASKWTRWTHHPAFPKDPKDRVIFAIRKHCEAEGTPDFYLGCRDAGQVGGVSYETGAAILRRLTKAGLIQLVAKPKQARQAFEYRLVGFAPAT